ncbi:MAG: hypothetical protein IJQ53_05680 [Clostridia bacterium]|nr:hypothetical protein [Clostridia bacterium]
MTSQEFDNSFWTHYIMLEKEFMSTASYVRIDPENYNTFSNTYAKLLLQIGSEVDVVAKETCKLIRPQFRGEKIYQYYNVLSCETDFINTKVPLLNYNIVLEPWKDIYLCPIDNNTHIVWWMAYNKVKHERTGTVEINGVSKESYKFANLKNTLSALGGLYQLLLHTYYLVLKTEGKVIDSPLPGSRLFKIEGTIWNSVNFAFDHKFHIDDNGCLILTTSTIPY